MVDGHFMFSCRQPKIQSLLHHPWSKAQPNIENEKMRSDLIVGEYEKQVLVIGRGQRDASKDYT